MSATHILRFSQVQRPQHATCQPLSSAARCHKVSRSHCCCSAVRLDEKQAVRDAEDTVQSPGSAGRVSAVGLIAAVAAAMGGSASYAADAAANAAANADVAPVDPSTYVPGPVEVGWQIWFAAIISTVPFVIGAYEFGKRILIQRGCEVCGGSGLVQKGKYPKKCPQCGGFFPWISWKMFLSANARPGNGGPLLQPRGQTSVFYTVPPSSTQAAKQQQQHSFTAEESSPQAGSASQQGVVAGLKNDRSTDPDQ